MSNPYSVTSSLESANVDPDKLAQVVERARREVDEEDCCRRRRSPSPGRVDSYCSRTFGDATNDSLYCVFSSTKAITSAAAWLLIEAGELSTEEVVADIVPEFGTNGKDVITVEQLFLHSAGFPTPPFAPTDWPDRDRRYARFAQWRLNWKPGSQFEYHPSSSDVGRRRDHRTPQRPPTSTEFVRTEVADPLGLTTCIWGFRSRKPTGRRDRPLRRTDDQRGLRTPRPAGAAGHRGDRGCDPELQPARGACHARGGWRRHHDGGPTSRSSTRHCCMEAVSMGAASGRTRRCAWPAGFDPVIFAIR